ncbi:MULTISPECIES: hypothetical protein [Mesorhizobium]|uniref:Uncharacterized protein n=1 Tax=Mesorhizobium ciceri TaxID=39645 RepID=A0AB38TBA3_9HYPH|nr:MULTISPECIES: hypothetical protein [Mesorhizobium]MDF3214363.1 hypothetical protein [Mesorhizobium ciceri]UTU51572.1 hypothetical protein LRP29_29610 [Mesorhizobium ciceri]
MSVESDIDAPAANRQPFQISALLQASDLNYVESIESTPTTSALVPAVVNS